MEISVSKAGELVSRRHHFLALVAVLAVTLLMALSTETAHAHEDLEHEFECEICLKFSFGDDLIIATVSATESSVYSEYNSDLSQSEPATPLVQANSRAPPLS